jgi:hypothetical protein
MKNSKFTDLPRIQSVNEKEEKTTERSSVSTPEETSCDLSERSASVQKYEKEKSFSLEITWKIT